MGIQLHAVWKVKLQAFFFKVLNKYSKKFNLMFYLCMHQGLDLYQPSPTRIALCLPAVLVEPSRTSPRARLCSSTLGFSRKP